MTSGTVTSNYAKRVPKYLSFYYSYSSEFVIDASQFEIEIQFQFELPHSVGLLVHILIGKRAGTIISSSSWLANKLERNCL